MIRVRLRLCIICKKNTPTYHVGVEKYPYHYITLLSSRLYCRFRNLTRSASVSYTKVRGLYRRLGLTPYPEDLSLLCHYNTLHMIMQVHYNKSDYFIVIISYSLVPRPIFSACARHVLYSELGVVFSKWS